VLTVLAVGWIGWRALGPWTGVLGALFLALAFIHVRDSHYATNDAPAVFLLTLSVAASMSLLRRPCLRTYLLAGLLGGLATSTKYNAGLFVVPLVTAHAVVVWRAWRGGDLTPRPLHPDTEEGEADRSYAPLSAAERGAGGGRSRALRMPLRFPLVNLTLPLALAGVVALATYLIGTPYTVLDFPKWLADFRTQSDFVDERWEGQVRMAPGLPYLLAFGAGMGWPMLVLAGAGVVALARRTPAVAAVLMAFPLAYLLFMLRSELFFVRFALPAVPFLCLLAGAAVVALAGHVQQHRPARGMVIRAVLTMVAVAQPTLYTVRHNLLLGQDDTRVLAERWALANVPANAKMQVEEYTIRDRRPRAYGAGVWQLDTDVLDVNDLRLANPTAPLRGSARYFMISSFQQDRFGIVPDSRQYQFYEALAREGTVVARFAPGRDGQSIPFDLEDLYSPFWGLDRYERPGPTLTVYELTPR